MAILQIFQGVTALYIGIAFAGALITWVLASLLSQPPLPTINYSFSEITYSKAKQRFFGNAKQIIGAGFKRFKGKPFCVIAESGPRIILPPTAVGDVNNEPALDFHELTTEEFFGGSIPGFQPLKQPPDNLIPNTVRIKITQNITRFMTILSAEMHEVLEEQWGNSTGWHDRVLRNDVLRIISRLSSRVFVGPQLYHNEQWLNVAVDYAVHAITAAQELRLWPSVLRPFVHWFLPKCRKLRQTVVEANKLVGPIVAERRAARAAGRLDKENMDTIDWFDEMARGVTPYNPVYAQLGLALASIHTTSDLMAQAIINLCLHPDLIEPLRKEAQNVLQDDGLNKVSVQRLTLLDSFLKETQRMKPPSLTTLDRLATKTVTLPDGTIVPKGTQVSVSPHRMWDDAVHSEPEEFNARRFLEWRTTPGKEHKSHLVSTSVDHPAFGHGKHACPGRFFAANETKVALVHMLQSYDIAFADASPRPTSFGIPRGHIVMPDPRVCIKVRKRVQAGCSSES